ncbi:ADP-ribosyl cyclase/cyclic ADP-ribose hydrolase-like isoform X1 [Rhopilema esculentum]|uniref:ADP-ribosyl cyclase/cyclic ADP-ribose hydrolase-like isoform X1 n=1 Tax=Rhopilema esculentum TaxID=499914 RepID=UPI0031CE1E5B|eukprot:gene795-10527_t
MKASGVLVGLLLVSSLQGLVQSKGTMKNLKEVFIGRCHEFYQISQPQILPKNCSLLWSKFHEAFRNKSACQVKPSDYKEYCEYADDSRKINQSLFWEATKDTVDLITQVYPNFVSLGRTIQGYIANRLLWCGGSGPDGINYTHCPGDNECGFEVYYPYWAYASQQLAKKATGVVHVLLNGSREDGVPTYSRDSYFAKLELPNMDNKAVTEVRAWVIYDLHKKQKEKCGEKSLVHFAEDAEKFGLNFTCTDNPLFLRPLMCFKYQTAKACKVFNSLPSAGVDISIAWFCSFLLFCNGVRQLVAGIW